MKKIAFFYSFDPSSWISCQKIVFNLLKSYQSISGIEPKYFHYNTDSSQETILEQIQEVKSWGASKIIILDHKPHPYSLLHFLNQEYLMDNSRPDLLIHIYGDFSLYYQNWAKCEFLNQWNVRWLCASERQANFFKQMVNDKDSVSVCPFPIDSKNYHYDQSIREKQRAEWKVNKDEKVIIYTGRLSIQKRLHTLIKFFEQIKQKDSSYRLHIYGEFDNIADPFAGVWFPQGKYFSDIMRLVKNLSPDISQDIHWFGGVSNDSLPKAYHGADLLVSFSVHHDEDYGMTVAEAISCGLPCLLSDWAGYGSFKLSGIEDWIKLVKVTIKKEGRLLSRNELDKHSSALLPKLMQAPRKAISERGLKYFSIESCARIIEKQLNLEFKKFEGFSAHFQKLVSAHINYHTPFAHPVQTQFNKLYKETYGTYVRDH